MKRKSRLVAPWHRLLATAVGLPAVMALFFLFLTAVFGVPLVLLSDFIGRLGAGR